MENPLECILFKETKYLAFQLQPPWVAKNKPCKPALR
jgi:hypothetical protein